VPHAFKVQKEHGKSGLVVILNESQAAKTREDLVGFVLQNFQKYGNTDDVFMTQGEGGPFPSGSEGMPWAAVIGVDGKLLMLGRPTGWGKKFDEAIEGEFKKIKEGWGKSPEAKKARAAMYGKGKLAEAAKLLADAEGKVKDEAKEDFAEAKAELDAKYASLKAAAAKLMADGRFLDAKEGLTSLEKSVKGKPEWEAEVATLVADFKKPEVEKELALDKTLTGIVKSIGDKRPTDDHVTKLKALAKKNEATKVGTRAAELAAAAAWKDGAGGLAKKDDPAKKPDEPAKKDDGSTPPKGE
jgi:hypothetical protein